MSQSISDAEPPIQGKQRDHHSLDVRDGVERIDSASARLVYVYLAAVHGATVEEVCDTLSLSRLTVFALLKQLKGNDLVAKDGATYTPVSN